MLFAASYQDLKYRMIDDKIWVLFSTLGILADIFLVRENWFIYLWSCVPLTVVLVFAWILKVMGEADVLAYASLLVTQPVYLFGCGYMPPAMSTFIYSNALFSMTLLYNLAVNLRNLREGIFDGFKETLIRKVLAMFVARAVPRSRFEDFRYASLAEAMTEGTRRFVFSSALSPIREEKVPIEGKKNEYVWIIPAYPLLPFILAGHLITLSLGGPIALLFYPR